MCIAGLVLIARAVFLLERGHIDTHTVTDAIDYPIPCLGRRGSLETSVSIADLPLQRRQHCHTHPRQFYEKKGKETGGKRRGEVCRINENGISR